VWDFWGRNSSFFAGLSGRNFGVFAGKNLAWWDGVFAGVFPGFDVIRGGKLW
jgi:hypothetical protein